MSIIITTIPIPIYIYTILAISTPARVRLRRRGVVDAEDVAGLKDVGVAAGAEDLLGLALPLGVVDGVDPVLDLHDDAAVLGDGAREIRVVVQALARLERHRRVLSVARVHLERLLVRVHVHLDPRPRRLQPRHEAALRAPVVRAFLPAVDDPAGV